MQENFWKLDVGNVLTMLTFLIGGLSAFFKLRGESTARHGENQMEIHSIKSSIQRVDKKLDETTERAFDIGLKIGEHIAEDRIKHTEIDRRLAENLSDLKDLKKQQERKT